MRTYTFNILFILGCLTPFMAQGQQQIIEAFDAIINCKDAQIEANHFLNRDMGTGVKIGQSDVYDFELPKKKIPLLKNVLQAFDQDTEMAYSVCSGEVNERRKDVILAVGDGKSNNVTLTTPGERFIYACFLAPKDEDPEGNYRYAYGISYEDIDEDFDEVSGRIVITYASTMKFRQDNSSRTQVRDLSQPETWANQANINKVEAWANETSQSKSTEPWIRVFINYVTAMGYSNKHTRATNAGYLYEVASNADKYQNVTEKDKETARGILQSLISDNANSDPVVQQILKSALESLN